MTLKPRQLASSATTDKTYASLKCPSFVLHETTTVVISHRFCLRQLYNVSRCMLHWYQTLSLERSFPQVPVAGTSDFMSDDSMYYAARRKLNSKEWFFFYCFQFLVFRYISVSFRSLTLSLHYTFFLLKFGEFVAYLYCHSNSYK